VSGDEMHRNWGEKMQVVPTKHDLATPDEFFSTITSVTFIWESPQGKNSSCNSKSPIRKNKLTQKFSATRTEQSSRSHSLPCKGKTILHLIFSIGSMYELGIAREYRAYFSAAQRARVFFGGTSASIQFSVEEPSNNIE